MALRVVRAQESAEEARPLRLWLAGRRDEALEALARPQTGERVAEARDLVARALADGPEHAARLGQAAAAWDDEIEAYRVVKDGVERLLEAGDRAGGGRFPPFGLGVLEIALPLLALRPHEPVLLNYAGVALFGLGEAKAALQLFEAAARLDPELENVRGNLRASRERARNPVRVPMAPALGVRVREVKGRAEHAAMASRARVEQGRISLVMIVRDEEEMLPGCLESVAGAVDELIVVDTGSTDRTVAIAESFGATVLHHAWNGSFSDARNASLEAATGDWCLWLDADERLEDGDAAALRALTARPWREAYWLVETNYTGQAEAGTAVTHNALRLFRNRDRYRFSGAIHEQIRVSMPQDLPERFEATRLRLRHYGYLKDVVDARGKRERNLDLLREELRRDPRQPFTHFNIGTELMLAGEIDGSLRHLEEARRLLSDAGGLDRTGYGSILATRLVAARRMAGDLDGADALACELLGLWPTLTDLLAERAQVARERGDVDAAEALLRCCLQQGDAPSELAGVVGTGSYLALCWLAGLLAEQGRDAEADALWERSLAEHPGFLPAGLQLAQHLLSLDGADPEAVHARLDALGHDELTWHLFIGTAFYEAGHADHAERDFRAVLAQVANHPAARVGLGECLLTDHRYAEVLAEAGKLPEGTPAALATERHRALAAALLGDAGTARAAAEELVALGGEPAEAALLAMAAGCIAAGEPARALPPAAAPHALTILDALAKLEEFEAFEACVPLLGAALPDVRESSLALGELYLQRGFYQLAAGEAMGVLESSGPDARTLALLGKSAVAEGLFEDALPVLEASLELQPEQPAVRHIVDELHRRAAA